jgi:bifunctional non-homologous end joining protein LigD
VKRSLPGESRKLLDYIAPMLAHETSEPFDDKDWVFEIKWDGYRAIAELRSDEIKLYSRNGNTFNGSYPLVVQELEKIKQHAVLDGEIVVSDEEGKPSFQLLQDYDSNRHLPINYYVFDILELNGKNVCHLPLLERKKLLKKIIPENEVIKYSDHIAEKGKDFFKAAVKLDMEGILAKKADSNYYPGRRTKEWLKIKHRKTQEAIIVGFTEPRESRKYFGALVLGVIKKGKLIYAGHTGTGFTQQTLKETWNMLKPLIRKESPFNARIKTNMPVTWVEPRLVCEVRFSEITKDGSMRHPVFLHLRPDKKEKEVTMENMKPLTKKEVKEETTGEKTYSFGKIKVKASRIDKVFWPDEGITKGDVLEYYNQMADYILPYLKNRPESLKRNPNGIGDSGFFQKDAGGAAPDWVKSIKLFSDSANKNIDYILCNNKATLIYLANLGCIEINPWHSAVPTLDKPDYLIIDIDPSEKNTFDQVIDSANVIHAVLEKAKAPNFCKTSGASGMHVYVPMGGKYTYEQVKFFAELICQLTNDELPSFTTLERNLRKRGPKHIYLDHLQNRKGQTIACVYSLRPHPGATVSTPLDWKEVKPGLHPSQFTIYTIPERIQKTGDIFTGILGKGIDMKKCLKLLGA